MAPSKNKGKSIASSSGQQKGKTPRKSRAPSSDSEGTDNEEVMKKLNNRPLILERGMEEVPPFKEYIDAQFWDELCTQPKLAVPEIVREFYAALPNHNKFRVMVRGVVVNFSPTAINTHYNLLSDEGALMKRDCYTLIVRDGENRERLRDRIANDRFTGALDGNWSHFEYKFMTPLAKAWVNFVSSRLLPSTHMTHITKDRVLLTYLILTKRGMDVGSVIKDRMIVAMKDPHPKSGLPFPHLITALCLEQGVKRVVEDTTVKPKKRISPTTFEAPQDEQGDNHGAHGGDQADPQPQQRATTSRSRRGQSQHRDECIQQLVDENVSLRARLDSFMNEQRAVNERILNFLQPPTTNVYTRRRRND